MRKNGKPDTLSYRRHQGSISVPLRFADLPEVSILPDQFTPVRTRSPQVALVGAVLVQALQDMQQALQQPTSRHSRLLSENKAWLWREDNEWPFSFVNCCQILGYDPPQLRARIERWLAGAAEGAMESKTIRWYVADALPNDDVPLWQRSAAIDAEGNVYIPWAVAGRTDDLLRLVARFGTTTILDEAHLYVPTGAVMAEFPECRAVCQQIEQRVRS